MRQTSDIQLLPVQGRLFHAMEWNVAWDFSFDQIDIRIGLQQRWETEFELPEANVYQYRNSMVVDASLTIFVECEPAGISMRAESWQVIAALMKDCLAACF